MEHGDGDETRRTDNLDPSVLFKIVTQEPTDEREEGSTFVKLSLFAGGVVRR